MVTAAVAPAPILFDEPADAAGLLTARLGHTRFLIVPERRYLMFDGHGAPGGESFQAAFGALYPVAYTLHFALKRRGVTAPVGASEGLYWFGDVEGPITPAEFSRHDIGSWSWRLMLPVPEAATPEEIEAALAEVARKKAPPALALLRIERWEEGRAAQTLHVGPYEAEPPTITALHEAIAEAGLRQRGCHHEIYISDPNRTAPDRLKTIIRQPVALAR